MSTVTTPPATGTVGVQPPPSSGKGRSGPKGNSVGDVAVSGFSHLFLLVWGAMVVLPLLWVVMSSFKTDAEIIKNPLSMIPDGLHWDNFSRAWTNGHFTDVFLDTVIIVGGGVFLTMLLGSMAAYVLARYEFPGNRVIYYMFLAGLTLPVYMAAVPLYKGIDNMGNILPFLGHNQYVMLPMAKPGLISIGIFNVIGQWNQWYLPVLLMQPDGGEAKKAPIAQALIDLSVNQGYRSDWSGMFAGLTMAMLPVLAVYIIFQRQVQAGLTGSITK